MASTSNLTLRQLEVFAMASRSESFSAAAKKLGISQPSLSSTIAKIEEQFGLSLFDRTTRSLTPTAEGERLSGIVDELLENLRASLDSVKDTVSGARGRVSIGLMPSVASSIAPQALRAFATQFPEVDVRIQDVNREVVVGLVMDRAVDFGVISRTADVAELTTEFLCIDRFHIVCTPNHRLAKKRSVKWSDTANEPIILAGMSRIRHDAEAAWLRANVPIKARLEVNEIMTGLSMVAAGLGVTALPSLQIPEIVNSRLVTRPLSDPEVSREIFLVWRSDRKLSSRVSTMMDCFRLAFKGFART